MRNQLLRSKTLSRKPTQRFDPSINTTTEIFSKTDCITAAWRLKYYMQLKYIHGYTPTDLDFSLWHRKSTRQKLVIQCEGTLFSDLYRRRIARPGFSFEWSNYYKSLLKERLNVRHLPILQAARDLKMNITLLCTTPYDYSYVVNELLEKWQLKDWFYLVFKSTGKEPTQQFIQQQLTWMGHATHSGEVTFVSDTHSFFNFVPYADFV